MIVKTQLQKKNKREGHIHSYYVDTLSHKDVLSLLSNGGIFQFII